MSLPVSDQRPAVDLAADPLLHHLPPVELQARVRRVHTLGRQVRPKRHRAPAPLGVPACEGQALGLKSTAGPVCPTVKRIITGTQLPSGLTPPVFSRAGTSSRVFSQAPLKAPWASFRPQDIS